MGAAERLARMIFILMKRKKRPDLKRILAACVWLAFSATTLAQSKLFQGSFGHEYTAKKNEAVWTIDFEPKSIVLITHGYQSKATLHELTKAEKDAFWKRMMWPASSGTQARCVGNAEDLFCYVPMTERQEISWLQENRSDYFYYSQMAGVMEVTRIPR